MKTCPLCNTEYEATENFCKKDGTKLVEKVVVSNEIVCKKCNAKNPQGSKFCSNCGASLEVKKTIFKCQKCKLEYFNGEKFCNSCGGKITENGEKRIFDDFVLVEGNETVKDFYICKYEVTQKLYESVMGTNPSHFKGDDRPVEMVSWYDAVEFCNKLSEKEGLTPCYSESGENTKCDFTANGYRLPAEEEWEYAAKGGNKSRNYTYAGSNNIDEVAWYDENSNNETHPVGQKKENELGLFDMSGNVWELCWEAYDNYRYARGGSYFQTADRCAVSDRGGCNANYGSNNLGFRLVRTAK